MNKEFIPYEQALSMEKLGFVEKCFGFYTLEGYYFPNTTPLNSLTYGCAAPLYQQAFRFFREIYGLAGIPNPYGYEILDKNDISHEWGCVFETEVSNEYKEAELACIVKLIERAKTK